jgi:Ser/Thr protein kinase RdoA (MazF antagonist)
MGVPTIATSRIEEARAAARTFQISGRLADIEPHERGHIHSTFVSTWLVNGARQRFLHQHLNDRVFADIPGLMHNVECVTGYLREKNGDALSAGGLETLKLVPTVEGGSFVEAPDGYWRTYEFIDGTESFDLCQGEDQAFEAARAFGNFQAELIDLDVGLLRETIPGFFSPAHRWRQFTAARLRDPVGRLGEVEDEVRFAEARRSMVGVIDDHVRNGEFPLRIVHGDTKLNNVLFDRESGKARSVIDLDTCMPAWSLYDFGDLVRFTAATSPEDETDLDRVGSDLDLYHALVAGYLESTREFLTDAEIALMPFAARLVTFTVGLRFLTDHISGDVYFKTSRPGHNLDRARVQFAMVRCMEEHEAAMQVPSRRASGGARAAIAQRSSVAGAAIARRAMASPASRPSATGRESAAEGGAGA